MAAAMVVASTLAVAAEEARGPVDLFLCGAYAAVMEREARASTLVTPEERERFVAAGEAARRDLTALATARAIAGGADDDGVEARREGAKAQAEADLSGSLSLGASGSTLYWMEAVVRVCRDRAMEAPPAARAD